MMMKKLSLLFFVCLVLLQNLRADDPLERAIKKVPVPNSKDFYATSDRIISKARSLRITEPKVCSRLTNHLEERMRKYKGYVDEDKTNIEKKIQKSTSDKLDEAKDTVKTANDTVLKELQTIYETFSTNISEKCRELGSDYPLKKMIQAVSDLQTNQQVAAKQLADLPAEYIANMQSHVPIEKINV